MHTGMLHTHRLVVILFLLIYLIKAILMILDKKDAFAKFTKVTKIPERVISVLFLATGIYLATKLESFEPWFIAKLVAVFMAIPLAVIGVKKENKALLALSVVLLVYVYGVSETRSPTFIKTADETVITDPNAEGYDIMKHGEAVYSGALGNYKACVVCHGKSGDLENEGATNLKLSELEVEQRMMIIRQGGNLMPAYGMQLQEQDMKAVATYLDKFIEEK